MSGVFLSTQYAKNENSTKILHDILKKHPYDLCVHELRWLIINVLFGPEYDKMICCKSTIPLRLYKLYQMANPVKIRGINKEDFVEEFIQRKLKTNIIYYGFRKLDKKRVNKHFIKLLFYEDECYARNKYSEISMALYSYSHELALEYMKQMEEEKRCVTLDCVICHGEGYVETVKAHLAFAGLLFSKMGPTKGVALTMKLFNKYYNAMGQDLETFTGFVARKKHMSSLKDELDLDILISELTKELES